MSTQAIREAAVRAPRALGPLAAAGLLVLLGGPSAAGPAALAAQDVEITSPFQWIDRGFRVGLIGGYMTADRGTIPLGPGPTETAGARMRVRFSSPLSFEIGIMAGTSDRYVVDPRLETGPAPVDTVGLDWMLAEAAIQVALTGARTWNRLQPYAVLGAGAILPIDQHISPVFRGPSLEGFRFELETGPAVQFGLGAEWIPGDRFGIGIEARDHFFRIDTPDRFLDEEILERIEELGVPAPEENQWTHHIELSVGVWYYF